MTAANDEYLWHNNYTLEVAILYTIAALGITLNIILTICILMEKQFRNLLSAFIIHGALINAILSSYCIIFALSLHDKSFINLCKYLGSSFVVIMTANVVNLIAIIASEVYKLNFNFTNENNNIIKQSNVCCVIFGLSIVYVASLILHLGPTLIGGNFESDTKTGFCLFIFGQKKTYVAFVVWIVIVTLVLIACTYYLIYLHGNLNRMIKQTTSMHVYQKDNLDLILTKSRAWTLSCITGLHILCWYPLFGLLISDRDFLIPIGLYRALTCLAWSNSFLEPLIYLLIDRKSLYCCHVVFSKQLLIRDNNIIEENPDIQSSSRLERIGDRLKSATIEDDLDIEMNEFSLNDNPMRIQHSEHNNFFTCKNNTFFVC